jgi:hypothetical protein
MKSHISVVTAAEARPAPDQPAHPESMAVHRVREACRAAWQDGYYHAEQTYWMAGWRSGFLSGAMFVGLGAGIVGFAIYSAVSP